MNKPNHIRQSYSIILMVLMMVFSIFGKTIPTNYTLNKKAYLKKLSTHSEQKDKNNASLSELSVMQLSVPVAVDFCPDFIFQKNIYTFFYSEIRLSVKQLLSFRLPLLEVLFEHYIVTNAP